MFDIILFYDDAIVVRLVCSLSVVYLTVKQLYTRLNESTNDVILSSDVRIW